MNCDNVRETRVLAIYSREVLIPVGGSIQRGVLAGRLAKDGNQNVIVPGDIARYEQSGDRFMIVDVLPRTTVFNRTDPHGRSIPILANLDIIVIVVCSEDPPLSPFLVDRYIANAEAGGVECAICLNKIDLSIKRLNTLDIYPELGYTVYTTSALTGAGIMPLSNDLRGRMAALVGASGVGKSSIINRLLGREAQTVKSLSRKIGRGRRTTSMVRFLPIAGTDGYIADTPGREWLGDLSLDPPRLAELFSDFRPFIHTCRFSDCSHRVEPGCAVRQAVTDGRIHESRYRSFLDMTEGEK